MNRSCFYLLGVISFLQPCDALTISESRIIDQPIGEGSEETTVVVLSEKDIQTVLTIREGGTVNGQIQAYDTSVVRIDGGSVTSLQAFDLSSINVETGTVAAAVSAFGEEGVINIFGGSVAVGRDAELGYASYGTDNRLPTAVFVSDGGTVNIHGGVIGHGFVASGGYINLYGGSFETGMLVRPQGTISIFGQDLLLAPIETNDSYVENMLTGKLLDGTPLNHLVVTAIGPDGGIGEIILHNIPEPTARSLVVIAVAGLTMYSLNWRSVVAEPVLRRPAVIGTETDAKP